MGKRHSFQEVKKRVFGRCFFCGEDNYALLDVHRIQPGAEKGKYTNFNTLTTCCKCHRLIHSGSIIIDRKYPTTKGTPIVHFWENGEEKWKHEELEPTA